MYSVSRQQHPKYGNVIAINREEESNYISPFKACDQAKTMRRLWLEDGEVKVRILVDGQAMTVKQAERWANDEYKSLPKCATCVQILVGQVHTHQFCGSNLFCSTHCADISFRQETDKLNDEEEIEYL